MSGTQVTLLWIYGAIIAVWPIRLIVLMVIIRRMEILTPARPSMLVRLRPWFQRFFRPRTRSHTSPDA